MRTRFFFHTHTHKYKKIKLLERERFTNHNSENHIKKNKNTTEVIQFLVRNIEILNGKSNTPAVAFVKINSIF